MDKCEDYGCENEAKATFKDGLGFANVCHEHLALYETKRLARIRRGSIRAISGR